MSVWYSRQSEFSKVKFSCSREYSNKYPGAINAVDWEGLSRFCTPRFQYGGGTSSCKYNRYTASPGSTYEKHTLFDALSQKPVVTGAEIDILGSDKKDLRYITNVIPSFPYWPLVPLSSIMDSLNPATPE